jgi:hypothetical protein
MAIDRSYVEQNRVQRTRLHALVGRLSDRELNRALAAGWTIAASNPCRTSWWPGTPPPATC